MAVNIIMPKWGHTMEEGKITRWLKQEGDAVVKGDELFEVETEKITNRVESPADGTLFQIIVPAGDTAVVGALVGLLAEAGEQLTRVAGGDGAETATSETPAVETNAKSPVSAAPRAAPEAPAPSEPQAPPGTFVRATPAASRITAACIA